MEFWDSLDRTLVGIGAMANPALVQLLESYDSIMATDSKPIASSQSSQLGEHPWLQF